ncbi:MAG TPA: anhydro-N-acetylmuramic acid kinase [Armatimonadota bacterium]|jgi:1,6-anhydro-N-acetylmuramate kinase
MPIYREEQLRGPRRVIGLSLSGDGGAILASAVVISGRGDEIQAHPAAFVSVPLDPVMTAAVRDACPSATTGAATLTVLDAALGLAYADAAVQARAEAGWTRKDVDAVGSRGAAAWVQVSPAELAGAFVTGVMELGDANAIAESLGAPVVSGFAARDIAAGGRGAPIEALADYLVFRDDAVSRYIQRAEQPVAGIWLPAGCGLDDVGVVASGSLPALPDEGVLIHGDPDMPPDATQWRRQAPVSFGWVGESYDAAVYALLADRTLQGLPGNLPQLTGAGRAVPLGSVTFGR